ncbi:hypothetical protein BD310DRAFT_2544 [Dichomitus squalens]|uniref:Uncharacterized protein n=1 Tax=Dichomitus squalens TaxID=114155 RepID=A0A4Q9QC91_9APHY|nr:hypothetical protein BD310DRAFT_2544 [Dichomitus squalens]
MSHVDPFHPCRVEGKDIRLPPMHVLPTVIRNQACGVAVRLNLAGMHAIFEGSDPKEERGSVLVCRWHDPDTCPGKGCRIKRDAKQGGIRMTRIELARRLPRCWGDVGLGSRRILPVVPFVPVHGKQADDLVDGLRPATDWAQNRRRLVEVRCQTIRTEVCPQVVDMGFLISSVSRQMEQMSEDITGALLIGGEREEYQSQGFMYVVLLGC